MRLTLLPLLWLMLLPCRPHAEEAHVLLRAEKLTSPHGAVYAEVWSVEESWNTEPVRKLRLSILGDHAEGSLTLAPGEYGFRLYHDRNDNDELDRNTLGIPMEPIGFSNHYMPKFGPPRLEKYKILLEKGEHELVIPLSQSTFASRRLGIGMAVVSSFSEYIGGQAVMRPIPFVTYTDEYLYILGPGAGFLMMNNRNLRLEGKMRVRFPGFDSTDSPMLTGLHQRKVTLESGLGARVPLGEYWMLSADIMTDTLGAYDGQTATVALSHRLRTGPLIIVPSLGPEWCSSAFNRYHYGVRQDEARPDRPAYSPGSGFNIRMGLSLNWSMDEDWVLLAIGSSSLLSHEVSRSPIVDDKLSQSLILGAVYRF